MGSQILQVFEMKQKITISLWLKSLACLAFVFALVLSLPSASHAAPGMHGDHAALSVSFDQCDVIYVYDADPSTSYDEEQASVSKMVTKDQTSGQCCSDICLSAVLNESGHDFIMKAAGGRYLMLHAKTDSFELPGFLRPPQLLI